MVSKLAFPSIDNTMVVATNFGDVFYAQFDPNTAGDAKLMK